MVPVDWTALPAPMDDGAAKHLAGLRLPSLCLEATNGHEIDLGKLAGTTVIYAYPRTGRPDRVNPDGWEVIPGAFGCTPQACSFRDHLAELKTAGASAVFGLSVQDSVYQREASERLHLPFPLLSDRSLELTRALALPVFEVEGTFETLHADHSGRDYPAGLLSGLPARSARVRRHSMASNAEPAKPEIGGGGLAPAGCSGVLTCERRRFRASRSLLTPVCRPV